MTHTLYVDYIVAPTLYVDARKSSLTHIRYLCVSFLNPLVYLKDGTHKIFHLTLSFMLMCTCATSTDRWMMVCLLFVVIEMLQIVAESG